jgi:hypothetical protein
MKQIRVSNAIRLMNRNTVALRPRETPFVDRIRILHQQVITGVTRQIDSRPVAPLASAPKFGAAGRQSDRSGR